MAIWVYCANGKVVATHHSGQLVPPAAYGASVSVLPCFGSVPAPGTAAPVLSGATQLGAYAQLKQLLISAAGISVNVGGSAGSVAASTDPASLVLLQGAYTIAQANSSATFQWVQNSGAPVTLSAAQITTIFNAVTAFVQATFTVLAGVLAAIASAQITTQAEVDVPPSGVPAWPVNS